MVQSSLKTKSLKLGIAQGDLDKVLSELIGFTERTKVEFTTEIFHVSARFRRLEVEKNKGGISSEDYTREFNSITHSLLEIIKSIDDLDPKFIKEVTSKEQLKHDIELLSKEFARTSEIRSTASRLRTTIHIARKMADIMIQRPNLIWEYKYTSDQGIICAIGRKVKVLPIIEEIEIIESVVPNAKNSITKGFLVNALGEFIYSGQLRIGDDERIYYLLKEMAREADIVLIKNIERVKVSLDYLTGRIQVK